MEGKKKIKVVTLYDYTQKQFEPDPNPQNRTLKLDENKSKN